MIRFKGQLVGGVNTNIFNGNLYQTSVINTKKELQGGTLLTWKTIEWAIETKNRTIDLGGANPMPTTAKEKGIHFYKEKWGGEKFEQKIFIKIFNKNKKRLTSFLTEPKSVSSKIKKFMNAGM